MEAHTGIVFRPGPAGRRPALADGPDVWVVARVFRELKGSFEEVLAETVELTELAPHQVRAAMRYYAEFGDEIDAFLKEQDDYAERAHETWLREQDMLRK
jgi:hypothetical protein